MKVLFALLPAILLLLHSTTLVSSQQYKVVGPITPHFQNWLKINGYTDDFVRADLMVTQGSYGGKTSADQQVIKTPVIFLHGNSDAALRQGFGPSDVAGFENSIDYFLKQGYTSAELYATSWGDTDPNNASLRTHDCATVQRLRRFLIAVVAYTGAEKVSFVTHSMGVTLARKIIKGGWIEGADGTCNIGIPLRYIDVLVGLSGANYGLCNCQGAGGGVLFHTCNKKNGFWPGDSCGDNALGSCGVNPLPFTCNAQSSKKDIVDTKQFLTDLNLDFQQEAKRVVSAWSKSDDLIMFGTMTWGKSTCLIPRSTDQKTYPSYTHMETKELTYEDQYKWVNRII